MTQDYGETTTKAYQQSVLQLMAVIQTMSDQWAKIPEDYKHVLKSPGEIITDEFKKRQIP